MAVPISAEVVRMRSASSAPTRDSQSDSVPRSLVADRMVVTDGSGRPSWR